MERTNHLSDNLKAYKEGMGKSLSDFARELSIPKSTIQAAMADGNTTLDTLIRIANALGQHRTENCVQKMSLRGKIKT